MYILFDWFESCSEVDIDFMSPVLVCAEQGFSCKTNSGIWLAFSSDRMTSKKMREISAISGAKENDKKSVEFFFRLKKIRIKNERVVKKVLTGRCGGWVGFRWCCIIRSIFGMWFRYCFWPINQQFLRKLLQWMIWNLRHKLQDIFIRSDLLYRFIFGKNICWITIWINYRRNGTLKN